MTFPHQIILYQIIISILPVFVKRLFGRLKLLDLTPLKSITPL
jgi:hypothetical protein